MKLSEFLTELNSRIAAAKVAGLWIDTQKEQWIYEAVVRVCNFKKRWRFLEIAKSTTTKKDHEYYDEPEDLKTNSIFAVKVDGKGYDRKSWNRYQEYKTAESTEKIFAVHNGFYFINPTPTEDNLTIDIWGVKKPVVLVTWKAAADDSVLPSEFDEPVIRLALASCLQKERRYSEAVAERVEVEAPKNPRIEGSGGLLARLVEQESEGDPVGYTGRAQSSRWE